MLKNWIAMVRISKGWFSMPGFIVGNDLSGVARILRNRALCLGENAMGSVAF